MEEKKENQPNTQPDSFFNQDSVKECFKVTPHTNHTLLGFMLHNGYKTVKGFAFDLGVSRSRLSQIIHGHIPPDEKMKVLIAKWLKTDSRIIFPEKEVKEEWIYHHNYKKKNIDFA